MRYRVTCPYIIRSGGRRLRHAELWKLAEQVMETLLSMESPWVTNTAIWVDDTGAMMIEHTIAASSPDAAAARSEALCTAAGRACGLTSRTAGDRP